ncbi:protein ELYS-like [Biomphalaria glabrata]|uniref:Protein ELYS-like n=1 Tax=Biomphalaria glabrata TaxID=6526 RepID=A0A9W2YNF6_BIOGL|nr:protein ELYS-like [Biomphalaria glabrata]KAI8736431.1 protein ELYS-like [Biomphalaria glabrata]
MKLELKPDVLQVFQGHGIAATHAGTSKDCQISWIYKDSLLEVFASQTNEILASWRFGKALKDVDTCITFVKDFKIHGGYLLLVALTNSTDLGQLCIFSVGLRKVLQVIEVPQKITALEVIFANTCDEIPKWILSKHLQFFCGLAAVGTIGGYVYLLDLCLDRLMLQLSTEERPKKMMIISPCVVDGDARRLQAISYDKHIAVLLDDQCHNQGQYYYRRQDDTVQKVIDEDYVNVTSLKYLEQAGILAIGFNFGCFQLWKLYNPVLDYSSRFVPNSVQVSNFVVQEPENDPRNFVYLWVVHDEDSEDNVACSCLYQLSFAKKDIYAGFGMFYDELESVCPRLDHKFTLDPYSKDTKTTWNSSLVASYTILNPFYTPPLTLTDSFEEGLFGNDRSLSIFVWKAEGKQGGDEVKHWMAIFDLNRWYHAQMPHSVRCLGSSLQVCSYWAVYCLDHVVSLSPSYSLLNVEVSGDRVLRFINNSPLPPEEHSFPSALQLTSIRFITPDRFIQGRCDGWQGQLLKQFEQNGVEYLVSPADFYYQCLRARLLPQSYLEEKVKGPDYQREVLLNLALERGLACTLISDCVQKWSDGDFAEQGCTLTMLLNWAWRMVGNIKDSWHLTCEMLYDNSGHQLDARTDWQLKSLTNSLTQLKKIFTMLIAQTGPTTEKGQQELEIRLDTINILLMHFEMVRWCISINLLPEIDCESGDTSGLFVYPRSELNDMYKKRRVELNNRKGIVNKLSLLLIDELVECQGPAVKNLWESLGGDGCYPPSSMQGIVSMYLLDEISVELKHAITLYLLQDLAALDKTEAGRSSLASFVERFILSPSLVHQVQGLWFIDHKDFEEGVRHLANPTVHEELCQNWKHISIVNTLLAQSEGLAATRFLHTKCVLNGSPQEQQLYISVLIDNKQLNQALEYMRVCQHDKNFADLMFHLLNECQKYKLLGHLLQHHLTEQEEYFLEQYLRRKGEPHSLEPLFLYYLHHSRFLQAYQLNEDMKRMDKMDAMSGSYDRAITRNKLMEAYLRVLPEATKKLLLEKKAVSKPVLKRFECVRPKPLSTVVRNVDHSAMSRSNFVLALMDKIQEAKDMCHRAESQPKEEVEETQKVKDSEVEMPLLRTPRPTRTSTLRASEVIYPEINQSPLPSNPLSVVKRKTLSMLENENLNGNVSLHQLTMECLQLLQTPTRSQLKKSPGFSSKGPLHIKTPQSILKVRNLSKSHLHTHDTGSTKRLSGSLSKKFGFSKSETSVHTSPLHPVVDEKDLLATPILHTSAAASQKQLRFVGVSPSPTTSPVLTPAESNSLEIQESIRLRDTSITPPLVREGSETPPPDETEEMDAACQQQIPVEKNSLDTTSTEDIYSHQVHSTDSLDAPSAMETCQEETDRMTAEVQENITSISSSPVLVTEDHDVSDLVRPDLHPSQPTSPTDVVVDEEIIFQASSNVNRNSGVCLTPSMTSSPIETVEMASLDVSLVTAESEEREEEVEVSQVIYKVDYKRRLERIGPALMKAFTHTAVESKLVRTSCHNEVTVDVASSSSEIQPPSTSITLANVSPDRTTDQQKCGDSPPATPPLSKKAKLMVKSKSNEADQLVDRTEQEEPRRRKTPERKSPSRSSENVPIETSRTSPSRVLRRSADRSSQQPDNSPSPVRNLRRTPERKSPSRRTISFETDVTESSEPGSPSRTRRKTPDRKSPSRSDTVSISLSVAQESPLKNMSGPNESESKKEVRKSMRKSAIKANTDEVQEEGSRESTPDRTSLRRSTRNKTPDLKLSVTELPGKTRSRALHISEEEEIKQVDQADTMHGEEFKNKKQEEDVAKKEEQPMIRRTRGKSKTPDRTMADDVEPTTPTRRTRGISKTPDRTSADSNKLITPAKGNSKMLGQMIAESTEQLTPTRRTRGNSKTPDQTIADSNESVTPTRRIKKRKMSPEEKNTNVTIVTSSSSPTRGILKTQKEKHTEQTLSEDPLTPIKKSVLEKPLTPTRKSMRLQTAHEESVISSTNIDLPDPLELKERSTRSQRSPSRSTADPKEDVLTPSRRSSRRQKSPDTSKSNASELGTSQQSSPATRKSTRTLRSPEKLHTDEIEPVIMHSSPNRSKASAKAKGKLEETMTADTMFLEKEKITRSKRASSVELDSPRPLSVTRGRSAEPGVPVRNARGSKTPDRTVPEIKTQEAVFDEGLEDQMPPLRLEIDEDSSPESPIIQTNSLHQRTTPDRTTHKDSESETTLSLTAIKNITKQLSPSFIFSPPLQHIGKKNISVFSSELDTGKDIELEVQQHTFVFSHPTIATEQEAEEDPNIATKQEAVNDQIIAPEQESVDVSHEEKSPEKVEEDQPAQAEPKPKRKRRTLYNGSPLLLSPGSPLANRAVQRQPTETQRLSASILRRYKPRRIRSRRLQPSQTSSRQ